MGAYLGSISLEWNDGRGILSPRESLEVFLREVEEENRSTIEGCGSDLCRMADARRSRVGLDDYFSRVVFW